MEAGVDVEVSEGYLPACQGAAHAGEFFRGAHDDVAVAAVDEPDVGPGRGEFLLGSSVDRHHRRALRRAHEAVDPGGRHQRGADEAG